jgi:hypothetical protein
MEEIKAPDPRHFDKKAKAALTSAYDGVAGLKVRALPSIDNDPFTAE